MINWHIFLDCDKQVVNGFFWDGKPVANQNTEAVHSTALGVRIPIELFSPHSFCKDCH